jgi:hypothetical protein
MAATKAHTSKPTNGLVRFIPILWWLPHYDRS